MGRWDIFDRNNARDAEAGASAEGRGQESNPARVSIGRGSDEGSSPNPERPETPARNPEQDTRDRRVQHHDRGRTYSLRSSELTAMTDIGKFRTVDVVDLTRFVYDGNESRLKNDLANLRAQGLVEEKTLFRAHKSARKLVTLTAEGQRIVRKTSGLPKEQRIYYGFVKLKELDHDADLYKVYQKAAEEIRAKGGKLTRVRLDFELKESINRAKEAGGHMSDEERKRFLATVAEEQGLTVINGTTHLPDIQIEHETRDGEAERQNLELLSRNYREEGIRGKAAAGFRIFARSGDASRVRRALHDSGMVREVLSL